MGQGFKINPLPARTWNWLNMNETDLGPVTVEEASAVTVEGRAPAKTWDGDFSAIATGMGEDMARLVRETGADALRIESGGAADGARAALHFVGRDGAKSARPVEILARPGERLTVVMDFTSAPDAAGLLAVQTRFRVLQNAGLRLIQLQLLGGGYTFLGDIGGVCDDSASVEILQLFLGGAETCAGCRVNLAGRESVLNVGLGYLGRGKQRFDMNYVADHRGEQSRSHIVAGGVLRDRACKLFRGAIDFKYGAVGAEGDEKEDVLLLGDGVVNRTIPLILCAEEDVQGNHGATIGRLDEELLFYLCSRGMSREAAAQMVTRARLDAVCRQMHDGPAERLAEEYLEEYLKEVDENGNQKSI